MNTANMARRVVGSAMTVRSGYVDAQRGIDRSVRKTVTSGAGAGVAVGTAIAHASAAGSLAGYAGTAHVVSTMGLGGVTTAIAGAMGSSATGAAATSVVTSAAGTVLSGVVGGAVAGPLVVGALLIGGAGAATYGLYQIGRWFARL